MGHLAPKGVVVVSQHLKEPKLQTPHLNFLISISRKTWSTVPGARRPCSQQHEAWGS